MASQQSSGKSKDDKHESDLTTMLDASQRADLTLLIAGITDSMRNLLLENFDADAGLDKSFLREGMTEEQKMMSTNPHDADVEAMDKQRKLRDTYRKDLASTEMKAMKKDSVEAFDEWREQVLVRVGEVVNNRDTAKKQIHETSTNTPKPEAPLTAGKIVETSDRGTRLKFKDLYPPTKSPLTKLSMEQRTLILHSVLLLMLSLERYSARSRVLLLLLTSSLKLPLKTFEQDEYATAKGLLEGVKELTAEEETKKKVEENKESRKWKVGLATVAGATLIGVTGGLAAPLVAAGVGSVMGGLGLGATSAATYLGSVAGSTYLVGGLFGAYGGRMTGNMMDKYARQVEDFEFLPVHSNKRTSDDEKKAAKQASDHDHKLRVSICVSGWLTEKEEVLKPWRVLGVGADVFALKYELEAMLTLGNAMNGFVQSAAWGYAKKKLIAQTIFADLMAALWPIGLLKAARVIDNPFNIAKSRSEKAGEVLADALINKAQGERPVTLIGYSLGARVIYSCLMSLANRKAFGLIENAVLVGSPTPSDTSDWRKLRSVVSGRLINVYSENDYVLGFMYRTSSLQYGVAGLQAVNGLTGVENVDVSDEVDGHLRYRYIMGSILKKIGFEDVDMAAVEQEKAELAKMEAEEKRKLAQAQRKVLMRRQSNGGREDEADEAEQEAAEIEKDVQTKTKKSMMTKAIEYFYTPTVNSKTTDTQNSAEADQKDSRVRNEGADATENVQSSNRNFAQRAYSKLPSLPQLGGSSAETNTGKAAEVQAAGDDTRATDSYTSRASSYLPSLPKNLPSLPKSLPAIPKLSGQNKNSSQSQTQPSQTARKATDVSQQAIKDGIAPADWKVRTNLQNSTETRSASKQGNMQVRNPNTISSEVRTGLKSEPVDQSYTSLAASYLPSMPTSIPVIPGWSSGRRAPPKLEKRASSSRTVQRTSSGVKSPPPKLGPKKQDGVLKSPAQS